MRDAERAEFPSTKFPRIEPRDPLIWVRAGGRWCGGRIITWVHEETRDVDRWLIWTFYQDEQPHTVHAWLIYDPETVRQRTEGKPITAEVL